MKIFQITQYVFLTAITILFSYYVFAVTYPYKVVEVFSAEMVNSELRVGDPMNYKIKYCKYMDIAPIVYRELVDGVRYSMNATSAKTPTGCNENVIMYAGRVPDVASGVYHLEMRNVYKVNAFRDVTVEFETNNFSIIGDEK